MSPLLTVPQVAEALALSPFTVWRMVLDGRVPSFKIGRARRVAASDVQKVILDASRQEGGRAMGKGFESKARAKTATF